MRVIKGLGVDFLVLFCSVEDMVTKRLVKRALNPRLILNKAGWQKGMGWRGGEVASEESMTAFRTSSGSHIHCADLNPRNRFSNDKKVIVNQCEVS